MPRDYIRLRDRVFAVASAQVTRNGDTWSVEIDAVPAEFDGETWAPSLYHQGLRIDAVSGPQLQGRSLSWTSREAANYPHPEIGALYVFGHHETRESQLSFGPVSDGQVELAWTGIADVFWEEPFAKDVRFSCVCRAQITGA